MVHNWHSDADSNWSTYEMIKIGIILNSGRIQQFLFFDDITTLTIPSRQAREKIKDKAGKNSSHRCP